MKTLLYFVISHCLLDVVFSTFTCQARQPSGLEDVIQKFGHPAAFVKTKSVIFNSYGLVDSYRQSGLYHEYILVGPGVETKDFLIKEDNDDNDLDQQATEELELLVYDLAENDALFSWTYKPDLVHQNLVKEYLWTTINSTGMLPALTLVNTTFEKEYVFHTTPDNKVSYHLSYPNIFRSQETVPPMDAIIEFPGKTRLLRAFKTMIDYQTFGLLRWRLTPSDPVSWNDLVKQYEFSVALNISKLCNPQVVSEVTTTICMYQRRFKRLENPCIKDMFLLYMIRGEVGLHSNLDQYMTSKKIFLVVPMVYDLLNYKGWYDLTEAYCALESEPDVFINHDCGDPDDIVLTNDHLLILTTKGLWVSNSLNASNANVSLPYNLKPLLKFTPIDPCAKFTHFNCSEVRTPMLVRQTFTKQRLFYNPVCHLFQYPNYDDIVILVLQHKSQSKDFSEEYDVFTVLYASKPYNNWKALFFSQHEYIKSKGKLAIKDLLGIFFNHHRRFFDISLLLHDRNGIESTIRFVLPEPEESNSEFGHKELSGLKGNGFLEFEFPSNFHMTHFTVNPEPMDILFLGNQLWIAEAGGPFLYLSVPQVWNIYNQASLFESCSFNHPDRAYVCVEKSHQELLSGRVGVSYSPIPVKSDEIPEFISTILFNLWPYKYRQQVAMLGHFIAGYTGKIMLWYMYDHNELVLHQSYSLKTQPTKESCLTAYAEEPNWCFVCMKLREFVDIRRCSHDKLPKGSEPKFRMHAFNPTTFKARDSSLHGPLVPYLVDGDKVLLFEADIPDLARFIPHRNFIHSINVGSRLQCQTDEDYKVVGAPKECPPFVQKAVPPDCELYVQHVKNLKRGGKSVFLEGFRSVIYSTVMKSFAITPVPTDIVILILPTSNEAVIQLDTAMYDPGSEFLFRFGHIGQTLYIPEHFSVLLVGFPIKQTGVAGGAYNMSRMVGISTRYYRQGTRIHVRPFQGFIIDFGTKEYCDFQYRGLGLYNVSDPESRELIVGQYEMRREKANKERYEKYQNESVLTALDPPTYQELEDQLLTLANPTIPLTGITKLKVNPIHLVPKIEKELNCSDLYKRDRWTLKDGGCHLRMYLHPNQVIKQGGGRISLDKHDSISFVVKLRSLSSLGKSLMHKPMMEISNTNPEVLQVEKKEILAKDPQTMFVTLTPVGLRKGVATVTIRPVIISTKCEFEEGSFSLIVQVHRAEGRRLHVNYPIPLCKPRLELKNAFERPWKVDLPTCVTRTELLTKRVIKRPDTEYGKIFYATLPDNYRPPSLRGAEIPLSKNVYNVNPAAPKYKEKYRISQETSVLKQCFGRNSRRECDCSKNDELSDDVLFTDCKRRVYTSRRGYKIDISVEYDRIMRDDDQHAEYFSPKRNWSVYLEEINNRVEFTLSSQPSLYLETVNNETNLNEGRTFYDAKTLGVTLHGTGLFHFKVGLGGFESFDEVTGYFMIFCDDSELNHVQLVIIMLLTITICMVFVFCGFLMVRNRLSSHLPFQTNVKDRLKRMGIHENYKITRFTFHVLMPFGLFLFDLIYFSGIRGIWIQVIY